MENKEEDEEAFLRKFRVEVFKRREKGKKILNQNSVYNQSQECVKGKKEKENPSSMAQTLEEKKKKKELE